VPLARAFVRLYATESGRGPPRWTDDRVKLSSIPVYHYNDNDNRQRLKCKFLRGWVIIASPEYHRRLVFDFRRRSGPNRVMSYRRRQIHAHNDIIVQTTGMVGIPADLLTHLFCRPFYKLLLFVFSWFELRFSDDLQNYRKRNNAKIMCKRCENCKNDRKKVFSFPIHILKLSMFHHY